MFKKLTLSGLLLFATLSFLTAPGRSLAASDCGDNGGSICGDTRECTGFWFWKKCRTTDADYYQGL